MFVLASVLDIDERHRLEDAHRAALEEQLDFERFVAELSFRFINLPPRSGCRGHPERASGRICEQLRIDRSSFYRIATPAVPSDPVSVDGQTAFPRQARTWRTVNAFRGRSSVFCLGDVLAFSTLDEIPSEIDRASHRAMGTKSAVTIPLSVAGRVVGALGVHAVRKSGAGRRKCWIG